MEMDSTHSLSIYALALLFKLDDGVSRYFFLLLKRKFLSNEKKRARLSFCSTPVNIIRVACLASNFGEAFFFVVVYYMNHVIQQCPMITVQEEQSVWLSLCK